MFFKLNPSQIKTFWIYTYVVNGIEVQFQSAADAHLSYYNAGVRANLVFALRLWRIEDKQNFSLYLIIKSSAEHLFRSKQVSNIQSVF